MKLYNDYLYFLILLKVLFILLAITKIYLKFKKQEKTTLYTHIDFWKSRIEFMFIFFTAFLLIYLFNPFSKKIIEIKGETKILLFLFGFVLLISADYADFFKESKTFVYLQKIVN